MLTAIVYALVTGAVGLLLLVAGFVALDVVTPGHLARQVARYRDAAVVAGARLAGVAAVAFTTIWTNADEDLGYALAWTTVFGLVGIAMQTVVVVGLQLFLRRGADRIDHLFDHGYAAGGDGGAAGAGTAAGAATGTGIDTGTGAVAATGAGAGAGAGPVDGANVLHPPAIFLAFAQVAAAAVVVASIA